jgi:hypothetical protein
VLETHELLGGAYNNIRGPVSSTVDVAAKTVPFITAPDSVSLGNLPPRP